MRIVAAEGALPGWPLHAGAPAKPAIAAQHRNRIARIIADLLSRQRFRKPSKGRISLVLTPVTSHFTGSPRVLEPVRKDHSKHGFRPSPSRP